MDSAGVHLVESTILTRTLAVPVPQRLVIRLGGVLQPASLPDVVSLDMSIIPAYSHRRLTIKYLNNRAFIVGEGKLRLRMQTEEIFDFGPREAFIIPSSKRCRIYNTSSADAVLYVLEFAVEDESDADTNGKGQQEGGDDGNDEGVGQLEVRTTAKPRWDWRNWDRFTGHLR